MNKINQEELEKEWEEIKKEQRQMEEDFDMELELCGSGKLVMNKEGVPKIKETKALDEKKKVERK
jgi:hypothetical protein